MKSCCLAVPREDAERLRRWLLENGLLRTNLAIQRDEQFVYLPTSKEVVIDNLEIIEKEFHVRCQQPRWQKILSEIIPSDASLSSFDVVGDIAIIRIPSELVSYRQEIASTILAAHQNIKVVCHDMGIKDNYRVRDLQIIGGEHRTETIHREYGISIKLDVARVYFSPRLATERARIADQVKKGQTAIDMFTGVAPFPLIIATLANPSHITAIDINPVAAKYARRNVQHNKLHDRITIIEGDASRILPRIGAADHIIMNLPHSADTYFLQAAKHGNFIHYYDILSEKKVPDRINWLRHQASRVGKKITIQNCRKIGNYSPSKIKIAVDVLMQ
jgi:tRNA (guanine37-N1)-methyltransferase